MAGDGYKDLHVSCSYDFEGEASLVLVPYWYTVYHYGSLPYYFLMDGQGRQQKMTFPKDKKEEERYKRFDWPVVAVAILPWFLIVPIWSELYRKTGSCKGGSIVVLIWLVALIICNRRASAQQKAFLASSVGARKVGAVRMKSRLQRAAPAAQHRSAVS